VTSLASRMVCTACGAVVDDDEPRPFVCPQRREGDGVDHVLARDVDLRGATLPEREPANPFLRYRELLHSYRFARRCGETDAHWVERAKTLDRAVAEVDGCGFVETPCERSAGLAAELGVAEVWVKDETANVSGSHKARHLAGIALQLGADRSGRSGEPVRLGIASCGNAALAAAVVARAAGWPLETYVPPDADPDVLARLQQLGAEVVRCERSAGSAGDPCFARLRERTAQGVVPFTAQGSENGLCIEGAHTLFWELLSQMPEPPQRLALQVGGGAFASAAVGALREARSMGATHALPVLHAVQTAGGHPLERAWRRLVSEILRALAAERPPAADAGDAQLARWLRAHWTAPVVRDELALAAARRARFMQPWETAPTSVATGILDDETYDWRAVVSGMLESGGWPVVVDDETLLRARDLGRAHTGIDVEATGTAGLAGLLALAARGELGADERVAVVFTGVR
jgi:threonine dehydratase